MPSSSANLRSWRARTTTLVLLVLFCIASQAQASLSPPTLLRIHHPRSAIIDILPKPPTARSYLTDTSLRRRLEAVGKRSPSSLKYDDTWRVVLTVDGEEYALHMKPNFHLLHPSFATIYSTSHPLHPSNVLAYEGHVFPVSHSETRLLEELAGGIARSDEEESLAGSLGWARILVHDAEKGLFEGGFTARGEKFTILKSETYERVKEKKDPRVEAGRGEGLVVFRDRDVSAEEEGEGKSCSHDELDLNMDSEHPIRRRSIMEVERTLKFGREGALFGRQGGDISGGGATGGNFTGTIGQTAGCPTAHRLVYMGVAADCAYVIAYGGTENARNAILNNWNTASALYKTTFNISLGIVELFVQEAACPATVDSRVSWNRNCSALGLSDRLSAFSAWRGAERSGDQAGLWALMSGCASGSEVGIAWLGQLCNQRATDQGSQGIVSGTSVSTNSRAEWQIVAHEIGHNLGAVHDCTSGCPSGPSCCPFTQDVCDANGRYLMSPVGGTEETVFSPCSIGNICSGLGSRTVDSSCLAEPGSVTLISLEQCGNGILEPGEECDSNSSCCDPETCRFRSGASCDPASDACCTESCSFSTAGTVCRPLAGVCDLEEVCSGTNATCPADVTIPDGDSCSADGLQCASGVCTSRDLQCQAVGSSLGITQACSFQSTTPCSMTCQSPTGDALSCLILQSTFIDGTTCGSGGGRCSNGECTTGGSSSNEAGASTGAGEIAHSTHLRLAIPLAFVVGLLSLVVL